MKSLSHVRLLATPCDSVVKKKNSTANAGDSGDTGSISGWEDSPGEGNGYPLQYSCLENSMDRILSENPMKMQGLEKARKSQEGVIGEEENLNRLGD